MSPKERKLIGTWRTTGAIFHENDGSESHYKMDSEAKITFTRDRRELWLGLDGTPQAISRWHLEGDYLVFKIIWKPKDVNLPTTEQRERIATITATQLVLTNGEADGVYERVR